jgi:hypothetical protein
MLMAEIQRIFFRRRKTARRSTSLIKRVALDRCQDVCVLIQELNALLSPNTTCNTK